MKSVNLLIRFLFASTLLLAIAGCDKHPGCTDVNATNYNVNAQEDNGSCLYDVTFYFDDNGPNATVNINNQTGTVSSNYQTGAPACGVNAAGCANFSLPVGSYAYTASSSLSSWSGGTVVVNGSGCQDVLLPQSTGSAVFYTMNASFGPITVNVTTPQGNLVGTISVVITNGVPTCGYSGCATFDLPPGAYNYTATNQLLTANWSNSVVITADGCQPVQLQ